MSAEYATFGLAPATRAGGVLTGPVCRTRRDFVDFAVDGVPLLLRLVDLAAFPPRASDLAPAPSAAPPATARWDSPPLAARRAVRGRGTGPGRRGEGGVGRKPLRGRARRPGTLGPP
ncbi:hypothetical protein GCM10020221_23650 [Streptomyces thioluteus]|uniref:Uncharacterized protein n=1 Tax=Streptomyces thioluteus TaxID=66431 RepID=A0ABN3WUV5_STRTU